MSKTGTNSDALSFPEDLLFTPGEQGRFLEEQRSNLVKVTEALRTIVESQGAETLGPGLFFYSGAEGKFLDLNTSGKLIHLLFLSHNAFAG